MGAIQSQPEPLDASLLTQLQNILADPTKTMDEIWEFFARHLNAEGASSWTAHVALGQNIKLASTGSVFHHMLLRFTTSWNVESSKDQSPSQVVQALERITVMRPVWYLDAIYELLFRAAGRISKNENTDAVLSLQEEVARLWALMFKNWGRINLRAANYHTSGGIDWIGLPDCKKLSFKPIPSGLSKNLEFRIFGHFQQVPAQSKNFLAASVLATSDLFCQQFSVLQGSKRFEYDYKPFFEYLINIFSGSRIDAALQYFQTGLAKGRIDSPQLNSMVDRMKSAPLRASLAASSGSLEVFANGKVGLHTEQQENLDLAISRKIGHRLEKQQTSQIIQMWDELRRASTPGVVPTPLGSIIYDNLIYAFDKLGRPDLTIEVWNHMINSGVKPNADQWRKLLVGRSKDPEAMEKVWRRMLAAGIKPDLQSWNARIHSLLLWAPKAEQGLLALDEMTKAWLTAINRMWPSTKFSPSLRPAFSKIGDFPGAPKPNEYTLNTCISGLVKRRFGKQKRVDLIPHVFKWADGLEIAPNVVTYNTLIGMCISDGNMDEAMKMMKQMSKQNIEPDAATFNIFLSHIFKPSVNAIPLSPEEQEDAVISLLDLIDSADVAKDENVYSTLIDGLLKAQRNVVGANLVFETMIKRGVTIRPHVWTSFLTHYFQEADDVNGPGVPNFPAIEALWNRTQSMDAVLDTIFYDRMIEGYARFGAVDQALHFLTRMAKEAKKPGWVCLTAVLRTLLDKGLNDKASEIVHDVEHREGYFPHGIGLDHKKLNPDRNAFWQVVVQEGLRDMQPELDQEKDVNEGI
jgi:pentatricopeptide repeat protein